MPEIDDEDCARRITLVPHLVLEAVVENEAATGGPLQFVLAHTDPAVSRLRQAKMAPDARVGMATMRANVSPGNHDGEIDFARDVGAWNLCKSQKSFRTAVGVLPDDSCQAVAIEVEDVPSTRFDKVLGMGPQNILG